MASRGWLLLLCMMWALTVHGGEAAPAAADPVLEKRVVALSEELRCLVCQNQTIADSHAELAVDLKNQIREQMRQGRSDQAILDYMVARYGDFVLYRPPVKGSTALLWFGPAAMVLLGFLSLLLYLKKRRSMAPDADADEGLAPDDSADAQAPGRVAP